MVGREPAPGEESVVEATSPAESGPTSVFHDLECLSGLGDRLTDLWAAVTLAGMVAPGAPVHVRWETGFDYQGFRARYDPRLFSLPGVRFVDAAPPGARPADKWFSHDELHHGPLVEPLPGGGVQLVLRRGRIWGNNSPDRVEADLGHYGLDDPVPPDGCLHDRYRATAAGTTPSPRVAGALPADLGERVGVHIRLQDKLVDDEAAFDMNHTTWEQIEREALSYVRLCALRGHKLFVCSDDLDYRDGLVEQLRAEGGDVITAAPTADDGHELEGHELEGEGAVVDFFALSRCHRVVQMTKYSTFSIGAALVGDIPLTNFDRSGDNRLEIWRSAIRPD